MIVGYLYNKMKPHTCLTFPLSSLEGGGWLGTDPF